MPEEFSTDFVLQDLARSLTFYTFQKVQGIIGLTNASVYHLELTAKSSHSTPGQQQTAMPFAA